MDARPRLPSESEGVVAGQLTSTQLSGGLNLVWKASGFRSVDSAPSLLHLGLETPWNPLRSRRVRGLGVAIPAVRVRLDLFLGALFMLKPGLASKGQNYQGALSDCAMDPSGCEGPRGQRKKPARSWGWSSSRGMR